MAQIQSTIELPTDADAAILAARVRELEERLRRERARNEGLTRGISALSERVAELQKVTAGR